MSREGTTLHSDTPTEDLIGRRQLWIEFTAETFKIFLHSAGSSVLKPPFFLFPVFQFFKVFFISILQRRQMYRYSISSCNHLQSDIFTNDSSLNMKSNPCNFHKAVLMCGSLAVMCCVVCRDQTTPHLWFSRPDVFSSALMQLCTLLLYISQMVCITCN